MLENAAPAGPNTPDMPYFDEIFERLNLPGNEEIIDAFGARHVHWGYYAEPERADDSTAGLQTAAEALTLRLCAVGEPIAAGQTVLDAGCGFGGTIASLNERISPLSLTGLNIDSRQVSRAQQLVKASAGNRVEFVVGDACRMPFAAASFDRVLAVECIFHFPSRYAFFREAQRVLKPGGRLTLCDFVPYGPTLPLLGLQLAGRGATIAKFYGRSNPLPCTRTAYSALARLTGFTLDSDEDITENTLPSYAVMRRLTAQVGNDLGVRATEYCEDFARKGWIRYRILSFKRTT